MELASEKQSDEARRLLIALRALLESASENNWRRGIDAAIGELTHADGSLNILGYDNARSIFKTMTSGGRGFAEYYVWKDSEDQRIAVNRELDDLRLKIWEVFDLQ